MCFSEWCQNIYSVEMMHRRMENVSCAEAKKIAESTIQKQMDIMLQTTKTAEESKVITMLKAHNDLLEVLILPPMTMALQMTMIILALLDLTVVPWSKPTFSPLLSTTAKTSPLLKPSDLKNILEILVKIHHHAFIIFTK